MKSIIILLFCAFTWSTHELFAQQEDWADNALRSSWQQYQRTAFLPPHADSIPRSSNQDGSKRLVSYMDWTSGFYPGSLWYLYEYTKDKRLKKQAKAWTHVLEPLKGKTHTHDLGFMMYCSYGNAYRLSGDKKYKEILIQTARNLCKRFNPVTGCIRSWDRYDWSSRWQYPVIIDNMMNLELLFFAFKETKDSLFYRVATTHANTTMRNHFRADNSSCHVLNYDTLTGAVINCTTHQGYSNTSAWARGQAWGLYGFTMSFRETQNPAYLAQAERIAQFIIHHPSVPADYIFYWDYDASKLPGAPRDASSAAIVASALLELSQYSKQNKIQYWERAEKILKSLSSPDYFASEGNNQFILKHSTGNIPEGSEIDVPIIYADYYFLEALLRYKKMKK
ncbi:MAG: glycoside hydrolase family 88 protein [Cytophagaceae bacterium]|jgi:hypothetical protein|nr:glycoside hydrolase family 88 protein [Cytophagaceae bacterium]